MKPPYKRQRLSSADAEINARRDRNDSRLKSIFESIFEKYGRDFQGIGDEIDMKTGEVVVDNGHILTMRNERDAGRREFLEEDLESDYSSGGEGSALDGGYYGDDGSSLGLDAVADAVRLPDSSPLSENADSLMGDVIEPQPLSNTNRHDFGLLAAFGELKEDELASSEFEWTSPLKESLMERSRSRLYNFDTNSMDDETVDPVWRAPPLQKSRSLYRQQLEVSMRDVEQAGIASNMGLSEPSIWALDQRDRLRAEFGSDTDDGNRKGSRDASRPQQAWTEEEKNLLRHLKSSTNMVWKEIGEYFPTRTWTSLACYWGYMHRNGHAENRLEISHGGNKRLYDRSLLPVTTPKKIPFTHKIDRRADDSSPQIHAHACPDGRMSFKVEGDEAMLRARCVDILETYGADLEIGEAGVDSNVSTEPAMTNEADLTSISKLPADEEPTVSPALTADPVPPIDTFLSSNLLHTADRTRAVNPLRTPIPIYKTEFSLEEDNTLLLTKNMNKITARQPVRASHAASRWYEQTRPSTPPRSAQQLSTPENSHQDSPSPLELQPVATPSPSKKLGFSVVIPFNKSSNKPGESKANSNKNNQRTLDVPVERRSVGGSSPCRWKVLEATSPTKQSSEGQSSLNRHNKKSPQLSTTKIILISNSSDDELATPTIPTRRPAKSGTRPTSPPLESGPSTRLPNNASERSKLMASTANKLTAVGKKSKTPIRAEVADSFDSISSAVLDCSEDELG